MIRGPTTNRDCDGRLCAQHGSAVVAGLVDKAVSRHVRGVVIAECSLGIQRQRAVGRTAYESRMQGITVRIRIVGKNGICAADERGSCAAQCDLNRIADSHGGAVGQSSAHDGDRYGRRRALRRRYVVACPVLEAVAARVCVCILIAESAVAVQRQSALHRAGHHRRRQRVAIRVAIVVEHRISAADQRSRDTVRRYLDCIIDCVGRVVVRRAADGDLHGRDV